MEVFFAIPCGDFYMTQKQIIDLVCQNFSIHPIINEEDIATENLWSQITDQIDKCDFFVADISSGSPNVILELGYALRSKHLSKIAILNSNNYKCPSDLSQFKRLQYGSYKDYLTKIVTWFNNSMSTNISIANVPPSAFDFYDSFQNTDTFLKKWFVPNGCQYSNSSTGFTFTNCHFPILSAHFGFLENYTFEFDCKIIERAIGWIVKGTKKDFSKPLPDFCIMFNISSNNNLTTHVFNSSNIKEGTHYHVIESIKLPKSIEINKRFSCKTIVSSNAITISINNEHIYTFNLDEKKYPILITEYIKTNQIGFRCHPFEVATIFQAKITEQ